MNDLSISDARLDERRKGLPELFERLKVDVAHMWGAIDPVPVNDKAIGLLQGQKGALTYRDWRVSLVGSHVSVGYYEIWQRVKLPRKPAGYTLRQAYFHVYMVKSPGIEEKLLLLHCDPREPTGAAHYRYKVAPHLHFEVAGYPWREAHIPLCDGWQDKILKSLNQLDKALTRAVDFIIDEFIPLAKIRE